MTDTRTPLPQPAEKRRKRRWWLYLLFGPPLALVVLLAALTVLLRTDSGLQRVEGLLNQALEDLAGQSVVLSGLHGRFPFDLGLDGLRLADAEGTWLELDGLALRWSGRDLLSARLRIIELSARRLELHRPPVTEKTEPKPRQPFQGVDLPQAFPQAAVERLFVERIILAEELAGQRTVLRLEASLDAGLHGLDMDLLLEALEGPAGLLTLRAGYSPDQDVLDLAVRFDDPAGMLAPLLGLPEETALELALAGDGPPAAWSGALTARAGDLVSLDSAVLLELTEIPGLTLAGDFFISPALLPEPAGDYLPPTGFEIAAFLPEPDLLRLERITLDNPRAGVRLQADLGLKRAEVRGDLALDMVDTSPLNALLGVDLGPAVRLEAKAFGPLAGPDIQLALDLRDIAAEPARIAALALDAAVRFDQEDGLNIAVQGGLRARDLDIPEAGLPADLAAALDADFDLAFRQKDNLLELHSLVLHGKGLEVRSQASLDLKDMGLMARLDLIPMDLQPWLAAHDLPYQGSAGLDVAATGTLAPLALLLDVQAGLEGLDGLPGPLPDILGKTVALAGAIRLSSPDTDNGSASLELIQASGVRLAAQGLRLEADAGFALQTRTVEAALRLELPDLNLAAPAPEFDLAGALLLEARAEGALDQDLALEAVLSSEDLAVAGLAPFPLRAVLQAQGVTDIPRGKVSLTASPMNMALDGQTDFVLTDEAFSFSKLLLTLPEGRVTGMGQVDLDTNAITAQLQGRIADIGPLARLAGQDMQGTLDLQASISPISPGEEQLQAGLEVNLADFRADFGSIQTLSLRATARDILETPSLDATLALEAMRAGETRVDAVTAGLSGDLQGLALTASLRGHALHPFDLQVQAAYEDKAPAHVLRVNGMSGAWAETPLSLAAPVDIIVAGKDLTLSPLLLEFGQAVLRAEARIQATHADLRLGVDSLPLSLFTEDVQGNITAGATLSGPKSGLRGSLSLLGQGITAQHPQVMDLLSVDLYADAVLDPDALAFTAELRRTDDALLLLQAQGRTAARLSLEPPGLDLPGDSPVQASLAGQLDLQWLGEMFLPETQLLTGTFDLALDLSGPLNNPIPSGRAEIRDAGYQHLQQGVLLRDLAASFSLDENVLNLERLTATDGAQGRLAGKGRAGLHPEESFPFSFSIQGRDLIVLDSPLAGARLADLALDLSGSAKSQSVSGQLTFERVDVRIRDLGGPQVVELEVIEINRPDDLPPKRIREETGPPAPPVALDMKIHFPARVFVRGRGLDSEWGGSLHVSGSAAQPTLLGEIRPVRGRMDLVGKRFTLSPESLIQFVGAHPPSPFVNIRAEQTNKDHTFIATISGVPPDVDIDLASDPPLPEDEVLPRMLFGRSLSSLTPVQAARLAMAVRELAGHGAGPDLMGTARDILLLDDLDLVTHENGDMSLRAGRYVNERVYLRLDSDLNTGEEEVAANIELTPRINLESKVGPKGGGLGLFWKHDY